MNGLHEGDIRVHGLLVLGARVLDLTDLPDGGLNRVEHGEPREDAHREGALLLRHRVPRGEVIGQGDLFWEPEVGGEAVPDLVVLRIIDAVPVDGAQPGFGIAPEARGRDGSLGDGSRGA